MADTRHMSETETTHSADEGHGDHHEHGPTLGPVDVTTWAYALAGSLLGLLVLLALFIARGA
jgi:hypothetical protein